MSAASNHLVQSAVDGCDGCRGDRESLKREKKGKEPFWKQRNGKVKYAFWGVPPLSHKEATIPVRARRFALDPAFSRQGSRVKGHLELAVLADASLSYSFSFLVLLSFQLLVAHPWLLILYFSRLPLLSLGCSSEPSLLALRPRKPSLPNVDFMLSHAL